MAHQIGEKRHVVGHLRAPGHRHWLAGEEAVPSHEGQENAEPQHRPHSHPLQIPASAAWRGLIALPML